MSYQNKKPKDISIYKQADIAFDTICELLENYGHMYDDAHIEAIQDILKGKRI